MGPPSEKELEDRFPGFGKQIADAFKTNFDTKDVVEKIETVEEAAVKVAKSFGQGRELITSLKQGMADAVVEVTKLGGGFQDIADIQKDISKELGRNVVLNSDAYKDLYAASQVSGESAKEIVEAFKDIGVSTYRAAEGIQQIIDVSRELGVNAQAVTSKVLNNIESLNKYSFQGGVEGLAKMAAQATSLRIDMNQTLNFAEKVFNPEGAIQAAAALQRLGVAQSDLLDPLRLMDLSRNDPTELQNQIVNMTKQFVELNEKGNFQIMPGAMGQLREISAAMGIPYDTLTKMALGSAELGKKMREITFPDVPEEQKKLIANMAEMGKSGQYEVTFVDKKGEKVTKAVSELQDEDIKLLGEAAQPKTLEQLAKEQLDVNKSIDAGIQSIASRSGYALAGSKTADQLINAAVGITQGAANVLSGPKLSPQNIREGIDPAITNVLSDIKKVLTGENSLMELIQNLSKPGEQFKDFYTAANQEIAARAKEESKKLSETQNEWINILDMGVKNLKSKLGFSDVEKKESLQIQTNETQKILQSPTPQLQVVTTPDLNLPKPQVNETITTENKTDVNGVIELKVTAPSGIDVTQLKLALQDKMIVEELMTHFSKIQSNPITAPNSK